MSESVASPEAYRPDPTREIAFRAWAKGLGLPVNSCDVTVVYGTVPTYSATFQMLENLVLRAYIIVHEPTVSGGDATVYWGVQLRHASDRNVLGLSKGPSHGLPNFESALKVVDDLSRNVVDLNLEDTCRLLDLLTEVEREDD